MRFSRIPLLLFLTYLASAKQPSAPSSIPAPLRSLPWGQLNFLHTTDTHGWHGGHLQEPQYSADWGDYISFASHLRARADDTNSDLLLIDTGDRVEGNGLYDATTPPGKYTFDIVRAQHIDVVTPGNHELYINTTAQREYDIGVPGWRGKYLASNVDVWDKETGEWTAFAARFRKFKTKNQGITVLAFGFLFDFTGNAGNTFVTPVEDTVKEEWFQDALREKDVDLFLVAGHVPVRDTPEYDAVYRAIREVRLDTPIVFFGGHTHIRDYRKWGWRAEGIESGRYMETVGFMSISGLPSDDKKEDNAFLVKKKPVFARRYIDTNLYSFHHHSKTNASTFPTELGMNISSLITSVRQNLSLDTTYGCAPRSLYLSRAPYPSDSSLLTWLEKDVLPDTFSPNTSSLSSSAKDDKPRPKIVIANTGALRFDVFAGPVTDDTTYLLSPFLSGFRVITNVPFAAAGQVLGLLNDAGPIPVRDLVGLEGWGSWKLRELEGMEPGVRQKDFVVEENAGFLGSDQMILGKNDDDEPTLPGYTTSDDAGDDGDDTVHKRIKFYPVPNCVGADVGFDDDDDEKPETVDLIYNEFIQDWILLALKYLGLDYGAENTRVALGGKTMTEAIREWVAGNWECEDD